MENLINALVETGATLGFDATGGGNDGELPGQILTAMEVFANKTQKNTQDMDRHKQVYIYGGLDRSNDLDKILRYVLGSWWLVTYSNAWENWNGESPRNAYKNC